MIYAQRNAGKFFPGSNARHTALAVDALLSESVIGRQFHLNRDDLANGR
jgi:hypothetical protein